MKLVKVLVINVITFAVLIVLINWACGVYLRRQGNEQSGREKLPNYQSDPSRAQQVFKDYFHVKHRYEPFVGWRTMPYKGETTTIDNEGHRTHKVNYSSDDSKPVIHFFGGSTMWGEGSDDQHTIPALVSKDYPQYEVYNHGQLAYNSRQELDALISMYSKKQRADIVIFYDGVNDAAFLCPKEINELPAHRLVPMFRDKIYVSKTSQVKSLVAEVFLENILKVLHEKSSDTSPENSPYDCISKPGKAEQIADMMITNWELANEIVTKRGGKFIAVLQPAAFVGNPKTDHLKLDEDLGKNFAEVYKHIKVKIREKNYPWVYDVTDKFDGNDYIYIDFCHVSPNGNEIIAKEISGMIKKVENYDANLSSIYP